MYQNRGLSPSDTKTCIASTLKTRRNGSMPDEDLATIGGESDRLSRRWTYHRFRLNDTVEGVAIDKAKVDGLFA